MMVGRMVVAAVVVAATGCSASRPQADDALKAAESAITAQHAEAMRFAPEAFAAVMATYDSARTAYDKEDWGEVVAAAERTAARARQLAPAITAGKEDAAAQWPAVQDSVQSMLTAVRERLAEAQRTRRYPAGMTAADVRGAQAVVDSLTTGLAKARTAFDQGDLAGAMHAAERVRMQAGALMGSVGLTPRTPHGM